MEVRQCPASTQGWLPNDPVTSPGASKQTAPGLRHAVPMTTTELQGRRLLSAAILAGFVSLSACSSSSPPSATEAPATQVPEISQSASPTSETNADAEETATKYFSALTSNDSEEMDSVKALAAPKSPAAAYLLHQATLAEADLDAGSPSEPDEFSESKGVYENCPSSGDEKCDEWSKVTFTGGKISNFVVNGSAIDKRLTVGSGDKVKASSNLGQIEFITAYQSVAGKSLFVTFEYTTNKRPVTLDLTGAKYRDPSGRQATATGYGGPTDLDAKSHAKGYVLFKGAKVGGTVTINVIESKNFSTDVDVKIKVG